jgi:hypothetical protein
MNKTSSVEMDGYKRMYNENVQSFLESQLDYSQTQLVSWIDGMKFYLKNPVNNMYKKYHTTTINFVGTPIVFTTENEFIDDSMTPNADELLTLKSLGQGMFQLERIDGTVVNIGTETFNEEVNSQTKTFYDLSFPKVAQINLNYPTVGFLASDDNHSVSGTIEIVSTSSLFASAIMSAYPELKKLCCAGKLPASICDKSTYSIVNGIPTDQCDQYITEWCETIANNSDPICGCITAKIEDLECVEQGLSPEMQVYCALRAKGFPQYKKCILPKCASVEAYKDNIQRTGTCTELCQTFENVASAGSQFPNINNYGSQNMKCGENSSIILPIKLPTGTTTTGTTTTGTTTTGTTTTATTTETTAVPVWILITTSVGVLLTICGCLISTLAKSPSVRMGGIASLVIGVIMALVFGILAVVN